MLLCAGATASSRAGGFADPGEPLDAGGVSDASRVDIAQRFRDTLICSPARAARDTARAMGVDARLDPALADMDQAQWTGRAFEEVAAAQPKPFSTWLANPTAGVPGGETMEAARMRTGRWLDDRAPADVSVAAITHPMIIRAAVAHALGLRLSATLAIDIAPLSCTTLSFKKTWRLQSLGCSC
ncbi:broad specificity phosphatase PhoE [Sphingomonas zeicaulis]|uniref:histidine phosphatase family protein n=1 Tax=Sphingomonas zeicaulis TaxID=1632740 RepID=UPI003D244C6A